MDVEISVNVEPASNDLPAPNDWMLSSFSPLQIEESLMRACFAPNAPRHSGDVLSLGYPEVQTSSEYVRNFVPVFKSAACLQGNKFYLVILASPVTHLPVYGGFRNRGLSLHTFPGIRYKPAPFRARLRNALHRFLTSPDAFVQPPEAQRPQLGFGLPEGRVPVRMFVIKLEDLCCPDRTDRLCDNTVQALRHLYSRLPVFRVAPYTASMYLATSGVPDSVDLVCIGYQKRVVPIQIPRAFETRREENVDYYEYLFGQRY